MEVKKMKKILKDHKELIDEYENIIKELSENDLLSENKKLKHDLLETQDKLQSIEGKYDKQVEDNLGLKVSLRDQMYSEKLDILNDSKKKINTYFNTSIKKSNNKLKNLEKQAKDKINKIKKVANNELDEEKESILLKLKSISNEVESLVEEKKKDIENRKSNLLGELKHEYDELKNQKISDEVIEKKKKQNNLEVKIGLNWVNKIGIIVLLLGIITAMKYSYSTWFNDQMKGIVGFILGGGFLVLGEWFNKKDKNVFSLGLCGIGIASLYITLFTSYFMFNILTMYVALGLSILVTGVSFLLSQRYNSLSITALSLIGGYTPFFSYSLVENLIGNQVYLAMVYLLILNILVFLVSFNKKWVKINYLSFFLNIPSMIYLISISNSDHISLVYSLVTFMMYIGITLVYPLLKSVRLKGLDVILLALNTVTNSMITYFLFEALNYNDYFGFLAFGYSIVYLVLANFIKNKSVTEKKTVGLFYITSMTFAVLMIPFQFGIQWALFGWLIESVLIISFGVKNKNNQFEYIGWVILGLSFISFVILDFGKVLHANYQLKYLALTISLVFVLGLYLLNNEKIKILSNSKKFQLLRFYKYFVIAFTWIYLLSTSMYLFDKFIEIEYAENFFKWTLLSIVTISFSYLISNLDVLRDKIVTIISVVLYILGDIVLLSFNFDSIYVNGNPNLKILVVGIILVFNILVYLNFKSLVLRLLKQRDISFEFYPLALAIYLLSITSGFLINQFNFENINLIISILFIVFAFGYIYYGFKNNYVLLRRFGLGFSIVSTAKLFIMDLSFLDNIGKIIAYVSFGLILIGISFMYQKLKNEIGPE